MSKKNEPHNESQQDISKPNRFQPGNPGGPGRPKMPIDLELLTHDTRTQTRKDILEVWNMLERDLHSLMKRDDIPAGKKLMVSCIVNAIATSNMDVLEKFLNRVIGKVKEVVSLEDLNGQTNQHTLAKKQLLEVLIGAQPSQFN